jgi:hypothetical protein
MYRIGRHVSSVTLLFCVSTAIVAQEDHSVPSGVSKVVCASTAGEREHCLANTSGGVVLVKTLASSVCLLGNSWGYDATGVWVVNGCQAEFLVAGAPADAGQVAETTTAATPSAGASAGVAAGTAAGVAVVSADGVALDGNATPGPDTEGQPTPLDYEAWGVVDPGQGFLVGRSDAGELAISAYALVRYMNQMGDDTFTDHLGNERPVDLRNDIYSHRVLVFLKGWMGDPRLVYQIGFWTVNTTDQDALFGNIGYRFDKKFNLYAGINGNPGSRSMQGSHPYWLGNDRVMADEFFRPFFAMGLWANGEILPGLWYSAMMGNTSSTLGVTASQIDRKMTFGTSMWWMPTTQEFGPRGAYGDYEMHEELATRFGFSFTQSPEERYTDIGTKAGNTVLKLADSVNLFDTGALADGVTITDADFQVLSVDAGMKYRGFFLQAEVYNRWLSNFDADGALPNAEIHDWGFYVQSAFYPIPKKLELYLATSQIYGDDDAGFGNSSEYIVGANYYPFNTRNHRLNVQLIDVNKSPVNSTFGYYTGGQDGLTFAVAFSIFF